MGGLLSVWSGILLVCKNRSEYQKIVINVKNEELEHPQKGER